MIDYIGFKPGKEIEWVELNLLRSGKPMSKSLLMTLSSQEESEIDSWLGELKLRAQAMGDGIAPYKIEHNILIPCKTWEEIPEYLLCLYYSFNGAADDTGGTKLFERISGQAIENFICGNTYVLGFPDTSGFNDHLDNIASSCYEDRLMQASGIYKDDGVDVFAYKLFGDNRGSNLYILMQCAAGVHWRSKKSINMGRWTKYIEWYDNNLILSMSTTDYVKQKEWHSRNSDYGLLIDRLRIYKCLYDPDTVDANLRNDVLNWCRTYPMAS